MKSWPGGLSAAQGERMKRKLSVVFAAVLVTVIVLGVARLQAQGVLTLEDLAERLNLLTADQDELKERLAALEAAAAATNWLAGIPIQAENRCTPYKASDYKYAQIVPETGGRIYSPYTGETFTRADEVDIEHIVARSEAHDSGLCSADTFTRLAFASDMLNLTFASPQVNREQKGDKDVADWLPELNQCWFVNRVVAVKRRYGLSMDAREAQAALAVLESCPSVAMEIVAVPEVEPTPAPEGAPAAGSETEEQSGPQVEGDALSLYDSNGNGRITCAEAREHGIAPVRSDHPAYQYKRDPDGDGVVCE